MKNIPSVITTDDIARIKTNLRNAEDRISREWWRAVLEGVQESPWYHDDNKPSLYRDRCMASVAVAVLAIANRHALAVEGLTALRGFRRSLPNTFATLPAIVQEWEFAFSARIDVGTVGPLSLREPEKGAELDGLNAWIRDNQTGALL